MSEEKEKSDKLIIKELVKQSKLREQEIKENQTGQAELDKQAKEQLKNDFVQIGLMKMMVGFGKKQYDLMVSSRRVDKRKLEGAKETEEKERQPVKIDNIDVSGIEGVIGSIVGALAGLATGFVTGVLKSIRDVMVVLKKVPKAILSLSEGVMILGRRSFRAIESLFLGLSEGFTILSKEGKFAEVFGRATSALRGLVAEGTFLGEFVADFRRVLKPLIAELEVIPLRIAELTETVTLSVKRFFGLGDVQKSLLNLERSAQAASAEVSAASKVAAKVTSGFKSVVQEIEYFGLAISETFGGVVAAFRGTLEPTTEVQRALMKMEQGSASVARTVESGSKAVSRIGSFFVDIRSLLLEVFEGVRAIGAGISKIKGPIGLVFDAVKGFANAFKTVFNAVKPLGELVGRLFVPIIVVYETITEFFKAFTREGAEAKSFGEKFFEGLKGTLTGIINELVMAPLDLVKSVISWAAGKLGFEEFESMLDAFSFEGAFTRIVDDYYEMMDGFFDYIGDQITSLMDNPLEYAKDMLSSIAGGIMDVISGVNRVIKKAIVKVLNLIPGVNIDTGEDPEEMRIEQSEKERRAKAEQSGVVNNPTIGYARADEDKLKDMTPEQLTQMRSDWADYSKVVASIDNEISRRLETPAPQEFVEVDFPTAKQPEKVNEATIQQVIRPEPLTPEVVQEATPQVSSPQVAGGSQQAKGLLDELTMREDQLAQTQAKTSSGGGVPFLNAPSNVSNSNNSVVNNTFTQSETSSRDDTDMMFIYRATGTSR
jgi:hypothetical protein